MTKNKKYSPTLNSHLMKKFAINIEKSDGDFVPLLKNFLVGEIFDSPLTYVHGKDICVSPVTRDNVPVLTLPEDWALFKKYINQKDDEAINIGDWVKDLDDGVWQIVRIGSQIKNPLADKSEHEYCYYGKNKEFDDLGLCDLRNEDYIEKIKSPHSEPHGDYGISVEYTFRPDNVTTPEDKDYEESTVIGRTVYKLSCLSDEIEDLKKFLLSNV